MPCFAQVLVAATMLIGAAGGNAPNCLLEVVGYPADGHTVLVDAFDYAPPGTLRTIWTGGDQAGALKLIASPTPAVTNYIGLPNVNNLVVAPLDMLTFVSVGTYSGPQSVSAWILQSITRYQSPGEIPGATRGLSITTDGRYLVHIQAQDVVVCDDGQHCIQMQSPDVAIDFSSGQQIGGLDLGGWLYPGTWYLYVLACPQGPAAIASMNPIEPLLPAPTWAQNNYSWFAAVGTAVIAPSGYVTSVAMLPAR